MHQSPEVILINRNADNFTHPYWAVRTCECTYMMVIGTFLFFFSSFFFFLLISRCHPSMVLHHSGQLQPSWDPTIRRPRTEQHRDKSQHRERQRPKTSVFLNQPKLISHFNLYRGKMNPHTHTSRTETQLLIPLCSWKETPQWSLKRTKETT